MGTSARLAGITGLTIAATALVAGPVAGPAAAAPQHRGSAVFVQSDNVAGNTVVAYTRSADGALTKTHAYSAGGLGGVLTGSVVDHLASQGGLTFDDARAHLYAVNAGSDTIAAFDVHGAVLSDRQVISSGGDFPVSVTTHGDLVYVLNARGGGAIQGYRRVGDALVRVPAWRRHLDLDTAQAPEFTHTPGQIAFTPDGSKLIVTTKAGAHSLDVFAVTHGAPSARPVRTALAGTVPFAVAFDTHGRLLVTEAGPSVVAAFVLRHNGTLTALDQAATGQAATCWITAIGDTVYASNAGSATVTGYRVKAGGVLKALGNTTTDAGTVDAAASSDGTSLYVQTGANGVVDSFHVHHDGSLTRTGSVAVPGAVGGEGIAAS
jgi:6-phosphogluconolactonase (cycloisomerase 2 family)